MASVRASLVARAGVAVVMVAVVAVVVGPMGNDASEAHDPPALDLTDGLLASTRHEFRICVQAGPEQRAATEQRLRTALDAVRSHSRWASAYRSAGTALSWGCPDPASLLRYDRREGTAGPGLVTDPSPFRVWVAVLADSTADQVIGAGVPARVADTEFVRGGDGDQHASLTPASTVLLIRERALADAAGYLTQAAGLAPRAA